MKNTLLRIIAVAAVAITFGTLAEIGIHHFGASKAALSSQLRAASDLEISTLIPFVQKHALAHARPQGQDFQTFLNSQVAAGKVSASAANEIVTTLQNSGQGMPVYTVRGWTLPIIAHNPYSQLE